MKTPFDAALRVERRALDAIRQTLIVDLARQQQVASDCAAIEDHIIAEIRHAAGDWQCRALPYTARLRPHREALASTRASVDAAVERLREQAIAAAAQRRSIARAAADFQALSNRAQLASEQAQADDFSGARIFARRQASGTVAAAR